MPLKTFLPLDPARPVRVALLGYGMASKVFHAPLVAGVPGLALVCVCSSRPDAVHQDWPNMRVVATPEQVWVDPDIDLVVIATPNESHYPLALAALQAGKHVLVDKPCTPTLAQAEHLLTVAAQQRRVMTVFQNRRFDVDFLALQSVVASGALGRVVEVSSHFDRYRPMVPKRWREQNLPGSGLWFDLGAHLVDQALVLWGMPDAISLDLACLRDGSGVDDWFHAVLRYDSAYQGLRVILHASTLVADCGPRWAVHGTQGSYTQFDLDPQEDRLKAGERPHLNDMGDWGVDPRPGDLFHLQTLPGVAAPVSVRRAVTHQPGNYLRLYANVRDHLLGKADLLVTPAHIRQVIKVLELGRRSATGGYTHSLTEVP